jgi:hypothetical protein
MQVCVNAHYGAGIALGGVRTATLHSRSPFEDSDSGRRAGADDAGRLRRRIAVGGAGLHAGRGFSSGACVGKGVWQAAYGT